MKNEKDNYKQHTDEEQHRLQKQFHESDLNYFASISFENGLMNKEDLDDLDRRINKKVKGNSFGFNLNMFMALLCGMFIGCSLFFVWYQKSLIHASHYENLSESKITTVEKAPAITNIIVLPSTTPHSKEHFSINNEGEQLQTYTQMENAEIKDINSIEVKDPGLNTEEILEYIPNAPVIFIYDLKIANYKLYYFKDNRNIDIRDNGLSAQFSSREETQNDLNKRLQERGYYAHEIIKDAMQAYHKKQYTVCISLLESLYKFNKEDVNAQFYLGMSYYNLGNFNKAPGYFKEALSNRVNIFMQESEFYLALCYENTGKSAEAEELFRQIASKKLFYSERAKEELAKF